MNLKKNIVILIKIIILLISLAFIAYKLIFYKDISSFFTRFYINLNQNLECLFLALILVFINWLIESYKWKILIKKLENIGLFKSFKAILTGITVSIFTPNRIGEFAGRILFLKRENRITAIFSTIIGNISQVIITLVIGLISLLILLINYDYFPNLLFSGKIIVMLTLILLVTLIILIYFNIKVFDKVISKITYFKQFKKYFSILSSYKTSELTYVLLISFIRYIVFIIQYYLILNFFNVHLSFIISFISIATMYIFLALIPTFAFTEIPVRSSVSLVVFGIFSNEIPGIIFSSVLIWLINLAVPALIGSVFFYNTKTI